jgi:8-oxo-dGTP pyrophosphatase MutT (NUDIX family)
MMSGAGFVVFKKDSNPPLMLGLIRNDGLFDIPKGHIDGSESALDAAIRECFEESSILIHRNDIAYNEFSNGPLTTFCAITTQTPVITQNPATGILEHSSWKWMTQEEFTSNCLEYLKPSVQYFYSVHSAPYNP